MKVMSKLNIISIILNSLKNARLLSKKLNIPFEQRKLIYYLLEKYIINENILTKNIDTIICFIIHYISMNLRIDKQISLKKASQIYKNITKNAEPRQIRIEKRIYRLRILK
jgi:hypothetical protein